MSPNVTHNTRLIAIDPGYDRVGIAVLEKAGRAQERLLHSCCFETDPHALFIERLASLAREVVSTLERYTPHHCAIENVFLSKNQKTAMHVAEVRGVLLYLAHSYGATTHDITPLQVKVAVTGNGKSTKTEIARMVPKLIRIEKKIMRDDEWDAIAIGLACFAYLKNDFTEKKRHL